MTIEELIEKRKKLGLSRNKLAKMIGYSKSWIVRIEWNQERRFSNDFLKKYEKAINLYEKTMKGV